MNISAVGASSTQSPVSSPARQELEAFDRQIKDLQKKIKETRSNAKLTDEQKNDTIALYQKQIAELTAQKQQKQMDLAREQAGEARKKAEAAAQRQGASGASGNKPEAVVDPTLQDAVVRVQTAQDTARSTAQVRVAKENELRIAASNSFLRGEPDPVVVRQLEGELASITGDGIARAAGAAAGMREAVAGQNLPEDEEEEGVPPGGSGRMEPGQFLDEEA